MQRAAPELVAAPIAGLLPVEDSREPLRVLIASLARGGAERIVLEWLGEEARRARRIELAVVHSRRSAWRAPRGVSLIERSGESPAAFLAALAERWQDACAPIATHLIADDLLEVLWRGGLTTVPTVHNSREGWRNDPARWTGTGVPIALACAQSVRAQMLEAGCTVPIVAIRHVPASRRAAVDPDRRSRIRAAWGVPPETLLVGAVGAFKAQKDFPRAVEIVARACRERAAALMILGGVLDDGQLAELDRTLERIAGLDMRGRVKMPGFVDPIAPYYAACDVLLFASRFEGLSMAAREGLASGLPVVALDVGGQSEIAHPRLTLLPSRSSDAEIARAVAAFAPRERLVAEPPVRAPRVWSVPLAARHADSARLDTLFVTANLNAGGAQRSLVNLARAMPRDHRIEIAVCSETTQAAFAAALRDAAVACFRPAATPDPFALAESLLARAARLGAATLCFWNADPRVKMLVAKFAPPRLRVVDASPGAYDFMEMAAEQRFAQAITYSADDYYARLDLLVLKHDAEHFPACRRVRVIPNGVAARAAGFRRPGNPRFLVSGRIAPSKRLETVVEAFSLFRETHREGELHFVGQAEPRHAGYAERVVERSRGLPIMFRGEGAGLDHLDEAFTAAIVLGTHQGCPNAVLEAMAASIPVIANASGGTGELVRTGETGWLVAEEAAARDVAEAMSRCARDAALAARMAGAACARVARDFSIEAMAARYLECFTQGRA